MAKRYTNAEYAKWKKQGNQRMDEIRKTLEDIVQTYHQDPEVLAEAFAFGAKFHDYSMGNVALIKNQNSYVEYVGSYAKWKELGYTVKKGEKGIAIRVPKKATFFSTNGEKGNAGTWQNINQATPAQQERIKRKILPTRTSTSFSIGHVFDIAQTSCPVEDYPKLFHMGYSSEQHAETFEKLAEYIKTAGIADVVVTDLSSISLRGGYGAKDKRIVINDKLDNTEALSTLTHELGHALLHTEKALNKSENQIECEADALSIMLQQEFGIELTESRKRHFANHFKEFQTEATFDISNLINGVRNEYVTFSEAFQKEQTVQSEVAPSQVAHTPTLYVDMDGVLAEFQEVSTPELLYEKGYYENLPPQQNVVDGIRSFIETYPEIEVKILSAVLSDNPYAKAEKNAWLDKHLPEITQENRIYTKYGESKTAKLGEISSENSFLLDDYTQNLLDWKEAGGTGIKLINNINNTNETWTGNRAVHDSKTIVADVFNVIAMSAEKDVATVLNDEVAGQEKVSHKEQSNYRSRAELRAENQDIKATIPIEDIAQRLGYAVKRVGNTLTLKEHDSIRVYPETNTYYRFSTGKGGSNIDFVMEMQEMEAKDAIAYLKEEYGYSTSLSEPRERVIDREAIPKAKKEKAPFELPAKTKDRFSRSFAYLTKTRGISSETIKKAMKDGLVFEDERHNVVFVGIDEQGKPARASLRSSSTYSDFKGDVASSDQSIGFSYGSKKPQTVFITEGAIDALSIHDIRYQQGVRTNKELYFATCGTHKTDCVERLLEHHVDVKEVVLANDNDDAGKTANEAIHKLIKEKYPHIQTVSEMQFEGIDVNDALKSMQKAQKKENFRQPQVAPEPSI